MNKIHKLNLPKYRTHFMYNEVSLYLFNEDNFPELVETTNYHLNGKEYTHQSLNRYKLIKYLNWTKIKPLKAGVDRLYSKKAFEQMYQELKSINSEDWKAGTCNFLKGD